MADVTINCSSFLMHSVLYGVVVSTRPDIVIYPTKGASIGGRVIPNFDTFGSELGQGGVEVGGTVIEKLGIAAHGGGEVGGEVNYIIAVNPNGGNEVSLGANGNIEFELTKTFSFSAGTCVPYWWQVQGVCEPFQCIVWGADTWAPVTEGVNAGNECDRTFIKSIIACNLQELCIKLKERNFQFSIDKIYKYTLPAYTTDRASFDGCGTFVQVYPQLPVECLDFFLTGSMETTAGMIFEVERIGYAFGEGGILFEKGYDLDFGYDFDINFNPDYDITGTPHHAGNVVKMVGSGGFDFIQPIVGFIGDLTTDWGFVDEVADVEYEFRADDLPGGLEASNDIVAEACNCGPYPLILELTHNLNDTDVLKYFLLRNNLDLPRVVNLVYNISTYTWQSNVHFKGYSSDGSTQETWDLLFEWACTDEVANTVTNTIWKLSIYIRNRQQNIKEYVTRLLLAFFPGDVCVNSDLNYAFALDTQTKIVYSRAQQLNVNTELNTCFDHIGLFKGNDWLENPLLNIGIYQKGATNLQQKLNITSLVGSRLSL